MLKVLVIGGGIGGLAAGLALRRRGIEAEVYEAAPELRPVGKGIWVQTNAMQVLDRLGLSGAVRGAGWPLARIQVRDAAGRVLMDVDLAPFEARYGHPTVSIHRAELVRVLADALPAGTLRLGRRYAGHTADARGVTVRFDDGTEARGDVLVAADGIRSAVREHLVPGVTLRYGGQTCYRGVADMDLSADLARSCWEVWGDHARFGFSGIGPGQVYWFGPVPAPAGEPAPTGAALRAELDRLYAGFPGPIPEIVRRTPVGEVIRTDIHDFRPIRRWWGGRVVLLGDAAHAMTPNLGQGGGQAIEDGYVLATALAEKPTPAEAFAEYQRVRMPKARWVVDTARRFGRMAHLRGRFARRLRNTAVRLTPRWVNDRMMNRLYALDY
jgi:2-polyprenyl-6-methoxyphenol hydroxylase-like FAD-dependent oxidoreductase